MENFAPRWVILGLGVFTSHRSAWFVLIGGVEICFALSESVPIFFYFLAICFLFLSLNYQSPILAQ
uniref:Uncharacterized protein n=1 Tax=Oryza brachyantha TaxID=4533 RepID=J3MCK9_ORYBR